MTVEMIEEVVGTEANTVREELYLHIGNSGVTFSVTNRMRPTIEIDSGAFGNISHNFVVHTNTNDMKKLGEMLIRCSEMDYDEQYCYQARSQEERDKEQAAQAKLDLEELEVKEVKTEDELRSK